MKKTCLIYANCQGWGIGHFLSKHPFFQQDYKSEYLINYLMISQKESLPMELLRKADLFIYQPVADSHGPYSTDNVLSYLSVTCQKISFPYLYNDAFWPLFRDKETIVNAAPITNLLDSGASALEIAMKFLSLEIDFEFEKRFQKTVKILAEKEAVTTVKAVPYILENYKTEKLFLTNNHPTTPLLIHCVNQMLSYLGYPNLKKEEFFHPNEANLPGYFLMSPYEKSHYQLSYNDNWGHFFEKKGQSCWRRFYLHRIMEICLSHHKHKKTKYYYDKLALKLTRSLVKYIPDFVLKT